MLRLTESRPRRPGERSALPQSRQDRGSLRSGAQDRGNGDPADSWSFEPSRPATRDSTTLTVAGGAAGSAGPTGPGNGAIRQPYQELD